MDGELQHASDTWVVRGGTHGLPQVWTSGHGTCITDRVFNGKANLVAASPELRAALESVTLELEDLLAHSDADVAERLRVARKGIGAIADKLSRANAILAKSDGK